ncbi:MAG: tryptophan 2,3-dioxygenase [Cyanobacteria bacterium]|nr:tryptophan 2,3-dioxygenase [Cyanobacteriota bacterium]
MSGSKTTGQQEKKPPAAYGTDHTPVTYNTYLKVEDLKSLQTCLSSPPHHDEPLFIIIHQTYELWFKLILHELDTVIEYMQANNIRRATFFMRRIVEIMKVLVNQIHILETMAPQDFLGFRDNLNPASGFQSSQFREIEFAAGLRDQRMLEHFKTDAVAFEKLTQRFTAPTLETLFYDLLEANGFVLPREHWGEQHKRPDERSEAGQKESTERISELRKIYYESDKYHDINNLTEVLIDFDELISLWRAHHVTVVERIIGFKVGTGGSEGVGYLRSTLTKRAFPELWQVRSFLEP